MNTEETIEELTELNEKNKNFHKKLDVICRLIGEIDPMMLELLDQLNDLDSALFRCKMISIVVYSYNLGSAASKKQKEELKQIVDKMKRIC